MKNCANKLALKKPIRASFSIKGVSEVRPMLLLINKSMDSLETVKGQLRKKFGMAPEAQIKRLLLSTGEVIDHVCYIERNDRILVELRIIKSHAPSS